MARWVRLIVWAAALGCGSILFASDLTKIDRSITRLPQFKTTSPEYCLLVFGPEAATHVWLVRDGDMLYVDRNGNGDLTEPGERVEADRNTSHPDEDQYVFKAGSIWEGALEHKDLRVYRSKLDYLRDSNSKVRELLDRQATARGQRLCLDVEMPGYKGAGIAGRVVHLVSSTDSQGVLQFAARPEAAPIVHFGGPWQVTLTAEEDKYKVGQTRKVYLSVGTGGLGPGTTTYVAYEGVIPPELNATLKFTFPPTPSAGQSPIVKSYVLAQRCCTVNIYGDVAVPADIGTGPAKVEVSLPGWPGTAIASSTHAIEVLATDPRPELEPVSTRLRGSLPHSNSKGDLCAIQFSPDGKRLIAGDYPGGIVHVWDIASGRRLSTFDTGQGYRGFEYFAVSPDWQTVYAPHAKKSTYERIERDGKVFTRAVYNDEIRVWDVNSGELRQTLKHSPPRRIASLELAPDGKRFLTIDDLPGEYEAGRSRAISLWDTATGTSADVPTGSLFSPDGRAVAGAISKSGDNTYCDTIQLFNVSPWQETVSIQMPEGFVIPYLSLFCPQGNVLVGRVNFYEKRDDYQNYEMKLVLWDTVTGSELFSVMTGEKGLNFSFVSTSADGKTVAASGYRRNGASGRLYLIDVAARKTKIVDLGDDLFLREPLFHPNGKWVFVPTQRYPKEMLASLDPDADELPQPRIQIIDVASGQILETLISPKSHVLSAAFSSDGKTLATSGHGEVLLWDMTRQPGE